MTDVFTKEQKEELKNISGAGERIIRMFEIQHLRIKELEEKLKQNGRDIKWDWLK